MIVQSHVQLVTIISDQRSSLFSELYLVEIGLLKKICTSQKAMMPFNLVHSIQL